MNPVSLSDDLQGLAGRHPALGPLVQRIGEADARIETRAPLLGRLAVEAALDPYRLLALLLKALWEAERDRRGHWSPWLDAGRLRSLLGEAASLLDAPALDLLILEQCALSCHLVAGNETAALAQRHADEARLLAGASEGDRADFLADKRAWLLEENQYDWLLALREQVVGELEATRLRYLDALGAALVDYVEAAHRLALMRYRTALDDPTLTAEELGPLLQRDLAPGDGEAALAPLDPELRRALFDTVRDVRADLESMRRLRTLLAQNSFRPMTDDEQRLATLLFRRLARLIFPDLLKQHPNYPDITPANHERLQAIWNEASATHGVRTFLSQGRLVNYVQHLQDWIAEVQRILINPAFHAPSRLLEGATLEARHADLRRAMADVRRHLHAMRDQITQLEFDPQHDEYRRVITMGESELAAERDRMSARVDTWNREARRLAQELGARHGPSKRGGDIAHPEG